MAGITPLPRSPRELCCANGRIPISTRAAGTLRHKVRTTDGRMVPVTRPVDRLVRLVADDITQPTGTDPSVGSARRRTRQLVRLAALGAPPAVAAALVPFRGSFPGTDAALLMVVIVVAVAAAGDRLAGALAAVSAGIWFDFFLTKPYERLAISHRADIETTVLLFVVGVIVTELTARGRHHRQVAIEESGHVAQLHSVARMMAEGEDSKVVIARAEQALATLLVLRSCHYDPESTSTRHPAMISQEGDILLAGLRWNWLPGRVDLPIKYQGRGYGRFVLVPTPGVPLPRGHRLVAVALADEVGAVLAGADRPAG